MQLKAIKWVKDVAQIHHKLWCKYHLSATKQTFSLFILQNNGKFDCASR